MELFPYFCGKDCGGDACPLFARIEEGRAVAMERNPYAGQWITPCQKGMRAHRDHYASTRLTTPLIRAGSRGSGNFRQTSWEEALDYVASMLADIRSKSGPDSVMSIASTGSTGALHNTQILTQRFFNAIGGCVRLFGNYSSNAGNFAINQMFGSSAASSGFDAATMEYSNLIVLWGANPLEARLGSELPARLMQAKKRGTRIIVIDPRRSHTARVLGADWIGIRPGSDPAFGYALLHELMRHADFSLDYVEERAEGFLALRDFVNGQIDGTIKNAEWAAPICNVDAATIKRLAAMWWEQKPVMLLPGYSIQRIAHGEESFRLTVAIQLATRNSGLRGASSGSINNRVPGVRVGKLGEIPHNADVSRISTKSVPVLRWADAVLNPQQYGLHKIRALYSAGGNFLNQGADVLKNIAAFDAVDFIVSHELFMTPTALHSDVVLPVADGFEKEDIGIPWTGDYVLYKPRIFNPPAHVKTDYEVFSELAERLGAEELFTENKSERQWIEQFIAESEIEDAETFMRTGIFMRSPRYRAGLDSFFENPKEHPLGTRSGKIMFSSPLWGGEKRGFSAAGDLVPRDPTTAEAHFSLLSPKILQYVHSQRAADLSNNSQGFAHMHPADLEMLGAQQGTALEIESTRGIVLAGAEPDSNLCRGVVWIEEGLWAHPIGNVDPHGSVNMLTSDEGTEESISCIMHGIPVKVRVHSEAPIGHLPSACHTHSPEANSAPREEFSR